MKEMKLVEKWKEYSKKAIEKNHERNVKNWQKYPRLNKYFVVIYVSFLVICATVLIILALIGSTTQELSISEVILAIVGSVVIYAFTLWNFRYDRRIKRKAFPKTIVSMILISGILLSCCTSVNAETIEPLGTMDYKGFLQVDVPGNASLVYVTCTDGMNGSDISMQNVGYQSSINATKYIFTSNVLIPEWWMNNGTISYLYQEAVTLQLYGIIIDYSDMVIPSSPAMILYQNLSAEYNLLNLTYSALLLNYSTLGLNLSNLTAQFEQLTIEYNNANNSLYNLTLLYNKSDDENRKLVVNLTEKMEKYDNLYASFTNMTGNISQYEIRANNAGSLYREAQRDIKDKDDLIAIMPLWFVFIMVLISISIILYDRRHLFTKKWDDPALKESATGYTNNASMIDGVAKGFGKIVKSAKDALTPKYKKQANPSNPGINDNPGIPEKQNLPKDKPINYQSTGKIEDVRRAVDKALG